MAFKSGVLATALVVSATVLSFGAHAQSTWDKSIKSAENIAALDYNGFGDSINQYSGSLAFQATDLSIPGNFAIPVSVGRSYSAEMGRMTAAKHNPAHPMNDYLFDTRQYLFGDWDLEIPHVGATFSQLGWQIDSTTPLNRCSVLGQVQANGAAATGLPLAPANAGDFGDFFHGYQLSANGKSETLMLANLGGPQPTTGGPYHWVTKDNWYFSCVPATNTTGEGFLAIDPAGTKYWFTWMSTRNVGQMHDDVDDGDGKITRYMLWMNEIVFLPTQIQDRFGNWVKYEYTGDAFARPTRIYSSESPAREITFQYNTSGLISSISDGTRTVTYNYSYTTTSDPDVVIPSLTSVVLPDNSTWQYGFTGMRLLGPVTQTHDTDPCALPAQYQPPLSSYDCVGYPAETAATTAWIIHPSGARADYVLQTHYQASGPGGYVWSYPLGVAQKTTSGLGLPTLKWSYAFGPSLAEVQAQCRAGACPKTIWTDELAPDYKITRRLFGIDGNADRGLIVQELNGYLPTATTTFTPPAERVTRMVRYNSELDITPNPTAVTDTAVIGPPVFMQGTSYTYHIGSPVGTPLGNYQPMSGDYFTSARRVPIEKRVTTQGDPGAASFTYQVNSWDGFDRPLNVTRSTAAAQSYSRIDALAYADNLSKWVVGQQTTSTNTDTGLVESKTDYDAVSALPIRTYSFGKLQQTTTYNANGTVASTADGAGHLTTFDPTSWKRGFPQLITFADGTSKSAHVQDPGWIDSVVDETGAKNCYTYDLMGRITKITYPSEGAPGSCVDLSPWRATTMSFLGNNTAAYGMPAGHWRQTTLTGNGRKVLVMDALWRPVVEQKLDLGDVANTMSEIIRRYDTDGQVTFESYPMNTAGQVLYNDLTLKGTRKYYDALGRPTKISQDSELKATDGTPIPLVTTIDYLPGFLRRTTDPMGNVTTESFRTYDTPSFDMPTLIDAPENLRTTIVRDRFGKPLSVTRAPRS